MTIKEAILKSLDEINDLTTYMDVHNHIVKNSYYDFGTAKTPASTISALLGDFIRNGDTRVKRIKQEGGTYAYYLTKNEQNIGIEVLSGETETKITKVVKATKVKSFEEMQMHTKPSLHKEGYFFQHVRENQQAQKAQSCDFLE